MSKFKNEELKKIYNNREMVNQVKQSVETLSSFSFLGAIIFQNSFFIVTSVALTTTYIALNLIQKEIDEKLILENEKIDIEKNKNKEEIIKSKYDTLKDKINLYYHTNNIDKLSVRVGVVSSAALFPNTVLPLIIGYAVSSQISKFYKKYKYNQKKLSDFHNKVIENTEYYDKEEKEYHSLSLNEIKYGIKHENHIDKIKINENVTKKKNKLKFKFHKILIKRPKRVFCLSNIYYKA